MNRNNTITCNVLRRMDKTLLPTILMVSIYLTMVPITGYTQDNVVWTFTGRVFDGNVGDESHPLQNVTVSIYGANDADVLEFIRSTTTDENGWYGLDILDTDPTYEYYSIRETDPPDYTSIGATTVDGIIRTNNWIMYFLPEGKMLTGNKFWVRGRTIDRPPTQDGPDLAILTFDHWEIVDDGRVLLLFIKIINQGDINTQATNIWAGELERGWESELIPISVLTPMEVRMVSIELVIPDEQMGFEHIFQVHLDPDHLVVDDLDRNNNNTQTPPIPIPIKPPGEKQLRITEVDPDHGRLSQEITLMVYGENFSSKAVVFIPEGIEVLNVDFISPNELKATITIDKEAPLGFRPIEVVNPDGLGVVLEQGFEILSLEQKTEELPDLIVKESHWEIVEEGHILLISALVANIGNAPSPEVIIRAVSQAPRWIIENTVQELNIDDRVQILFELEISDRLRGRSFHFALIVDPENDIYEMREDNNQQAIRVRILPQSPKQRRHSTPILPNQWSFIWIAIIIIILVITILTIRRTLNIPLRREWQEKAKEEEPPEVCQPCNYYCRKIKLEHKSVLHKITHFNLKAYNPLLRAQTNEMLIKGKIVDGLNKVLIANRRGEKYETLYEYVSPISYMLLQQIVEWLSSEKTARNVSIIGHLEGGKVKCKFILYHCKRKDKKNTWKEENKWMATIKDESNEPVGSLLGLVSTKPKMHKRMEQQLIRLILHFIKKV